MPDISDVAGEERPGRTPVGPFVIGDLATPAGFVDARTVAPGRVVAHPIGRIRDHELGGGPIEQGRDGGGIGAVPADDPMRSQLPDIPDTGYGLVRQRRDLV